MNPEIHHSKVISHVFFTGSAKQGTPGPPIGLVESREGRVCIKGVVPEIAIPSDSGCLYRMQVQQLCPPGPFSITFSLPGQVDPRLFSPKFRPDGIFEVVVVKLGVRVPTS
ncbi:hypothetical protein F2Q69_00051730 [Brassica cretica]|uniref:SHSP domain-containing protein n=1 Tax=Brassica cretica TaxID=69181 RepID=A0A8S9PUA6_BRACR|nr:hypothetical protein F2Q69_00051730 [Brassica cretica]